MIPGAQTVQLDNMTIEIYIKSMDYPIILDPCGDTELLSGSKARGCDALRPLWLEELSKSFELTEVHG